MQSAFSQNNIIQEIIILSSIMKYLLNEWISHNATTNTNTDYTSIFNYLNFKANILNHT